MKNQKGITLIALIITIIVMLILTGIAISTLVSEDGVLTKAEDVKLIQLVASIQEKLKLAVADNEIDNLTGLEKHLSFEEIKEKLGDGELAYMTSYKTYREYIETLNNEYKEDAGIDLFMYGDLYRLSGELVGEDLAWFATELVTGEEFVEPQYQQIIKLEKMNISTELGRIGTTEAFVDGDYMPYYLKKDMFFIDKDYNVYYMAKNGDVVTANGILKSEDISVINPNGLTEEEKNAYSGIYGALEGFTGDAAYAKMVVENDLDPDSELNSFYMGGYLQVVLKQGDTIVKENLGALMINPDYSTQDFVLDYPVHLVEYDDSSKTYVMYRYEFDETTKVGTLYDKNGNVVLDNLTSETPNQPTNIDFYNGYGYMKRFDGRDAVIVTLPEQEEVDMQTDLANFEYNIKYWYYGIENKKVKKLIMPDSIENIEFLAATRKNSGYWAVGDFCSISSLEEIQLPANVKTIYGKTFDELENLKTVIMPDDIETIADNAFYGLAQDITVRFPGGKEVSGKPWGAEGNITVITENN